MECIAGRIVNITREPEVGLRVVIEVRDLSAPSKRQASYSLLLDTDESSMEPDEALGVCFDVFHEHEAVEGLNPRLRRLWKTAAVADELVSRLFATNAFEAVTAEADDG